MFVISSVFKMLLCGCFFLSTRLLLYLKWNFQRKQYFELTNKSKWVFYSHFICSLNFLFIMVKIFFSSSFVVDVRDKKLGSPPAWPTIFLSIKGNNILSFQLWFETQHLDIRALRTYAVDLLAFICITAAAAVLSIIFME